MVITIACKKGEHMDRDGFGTSIMFIIWWFYYISTDKDSNQELKTEQYLTLRLLNISDFSN